MSDKIDYRALNSELGVFVAPSESKLKQEVTKVASLKEEAQAYEHKQTKNIADLEVVPVDVPVFEETGIDSEGKEFSYKYILWEGDKYRVPNSVLDELKTMLKEDPSIDNVKVIKDGQGLNTRYKVVQKKIM